jgi:cytochrome bd-type quinol oxidase subunit 2
MSDQTTICSSLFSHPQLEEIMSQSPANTGSKSVSVTQLVPGYQPSSRTVPIAKPEPGRAAAPRSRKLPSFKSLGKMDRAKLVFPRLWLITMGYAGVIAVLMLTNVQGQRAWSFDSIWSNMAWLAIAAIVVCSMVGLVVARQAKFQTNLLVMVLALSIVLVFGVVVGSVFDGGPRLDWPDFKWVMLMRLAAITVLAISAYHGVTYEARLRLKANTNPDQ